MNNYQKRTIWQKANSQSIEVIDQRFLPHQIIIQELKTVKEVFNAIREMVVRGAPLIGATASYGMYFATLEASKENDIDAFIQKNAEYLKESRPTAVNLFWAIDRQIKAIKSVNSLEEKQKIALITAQEIIEEDVEICRNIGEQGLTLIEEIFNKKQETIQVLTHCNAGRLGCVEWGTATAPIYLAHQKGIPVHIWVDETRPRNQGASLTAWELQQAGIAHTVIVDNAGGHLMQHGKVDLTIVGTDRTTRQGDVANKIGTYLKALAAFDNQVPFYVALPSTTIDWNINDGLKEIPIEERSEKEVTHINGWNGENLVNVRLTPPESPALNYGFDVTPARLISGLITERGICKASEKGLLSLFPEHKLSLKNGR